MYLHFQFHILHFLFERFVQKTIFKSIQEPIFAWLGKFIDSYWIFTDVKVRHSAISWTDDFLSCKGHRRQCQRNIYNSRCYSAPLFQTNTFCTRRIVLFIRCCIKNMKIPALLSLSMVWLSHSIVLSASTLEQDHRFIISLYGKSKTYT